MTEMIPPGERRELRSVVRQQFKVLRAEVKQRELELKAEAERRLVERYRDEDKQIDAFLDRIPAVAELVPTRRLREIESAFDEAPNGGTP